MKGGRDLSAVEKAIDQISLTLGTYAMFDIIADKYTTYQWGHVGEDYHSGKVKRSVDYLVLVARGINGRPIESSDNVPSEEAQRQFRKEMYLMLQKLRLSGIQFVFAADTYRVEDCVLKPCRYCTKYHRPECDDEYSGHPDWRLPKDEVGNLFHRGAVRIALDESGLTKEQRVRLEQHRQNVRKLRMQLIKMFQERGIYPDLRRILIRMCQLQLM
jgi:hypothetical protein